MEQQEWAAKTLEMIAHQVGKIERIEASIEALKEQQAVQTRTLAQLTETVSKLAVIEERQASTNAQLRELEMKNDKSFTRAFEALDLLENRIDKLEQSEAQNERIRWIVWSAVGLLLTAILTTIVRHVGL